MTDERLTSPRSLEPSSPPAWRIAALLADLDAPGTFATRLRASAADLAIDVKGVGPLPLPITSELASRLRSVAKPSPFGLREETRHDRSVRSSWEIAPSRVKIRARTWATALKTHLPEIASALGMPEGARLEAVFDKLLIYGEGEHFAPHQDSEKEDGMVGTLVVILPSEYCGGEVSVALGEEKKRFRRTASQATDLSLLAFYADCHHAVSPVTAGVRVVLTYRLMLSETEARSVAPPPELEPAVRAHFSTPVVRSYRHEPNVAPDRLVYLLDHQYTQRSLGWNGLKNGDRARVGALVGVAEKLDCECFLALAEVHEVWGCIEEPYVHGRRRWSTRWDPDTFDGDDEDEHELVELYDSHVGLTWWVAADGAPAPAILPGVRDEELVLTRPSVDLEPFASEYEGYQGNYGNTMERWYHRAAFVMWPRERGFVLRGRSDPAWALAELEELASSADAESSRRGFGGGSAGLGPVEGVLPKTPEKRGSPTTRTAPKSPRRPRVGIAAEVPSEASSEASSGAASAFESRVRALLPFWKSAASEVSSSGFYALVVSLARHLRDPSDVARWLAPVRLERLTSATIRRDVARVLDTHDLEWGLALMREWTHPRRGDRPPWSPNLEEICVDLAGEGPTSRAIASSLAADELSEALRRVVILAEGPTKWLELARDTDVHDHVADALAAMTSAAGSTAAGSTVAGSTAALSVLDEAFSKLATAQMPTWVVVGATRACLARSEVLRDRVRGSVLHEEAVARLQAIAAAPARREDDWSLPYDRACRCRDCGTLASFLSSAERELDWPLNKERRHHIHGVLDGGELPVRHTTLRRGSPFILQLRKDPTLFACEREHRDRAAAVLTELAMAPERATPEKGKRRTPRRAR
ncbi:MAG: 2OG-Fe(II) oxygenase [Myxococcota bacterium]|nr:2OG-Fe(II) oxygenase [Myxococcota bacterium]